MFDNINIISMNMSTIFSLLKERYANELNEQQLMYAAGIIQCANLLQSKYVRPEHFKLAFVRAQAGECGLDIYTKDIDSTPWYDRDPYSNLDVFSNYVMNIACIFLYETSNIRIDYRSIVDLVVRKRKKFKRIIKRYLNQNKKWNETVVTSWIVAVMEDSLYSKWKNEIYSNENLS